jgi:prolycopene isomerase
MEDVLKALKLSPKAIDIMCTYWGYLGVPTDELSAFHYWNMMSTYIVDGAAMGKYRSHELSLSLCKVIYDNGGDIFYNSEVTSFLYNDKGEAIGVEINHDKKIYAKEIVSNLIPNRVANMSPSKDVPERTKKLINARSFGISTATIYLGLDCSREELGFDDYTIFISGSRGARAQYDKRDIYIVNCLNKVIPDATPEGTCSLFFTMPVFGEDIPKDMTPEKYEKWKNELAMRYIKDAEETLKISIIPHIEEIEIATPVTMARYLGTPTGTIYGYKLSSWDNLMARIAEERKDITVPNLSYCGGHYMRGDGFNVAYYTGNLIGHRIVKKLKGVESKQLQPGERK